MQLGTQWICDPCLEGKDVQWICDLCLEGRGEHVGKLEAKIDLLTDVIIKIIADIGNFRHLDSIEIEKRIQEVVNRKVAEA